MSQTEPAHRPDSWGRIAGGNLAWWEKELNFVEHRQRIPMQQRIFLCLTVAILLFSACAGGNKQEEDKPVAATVESEKSVVSNDSTIYGTAGEFGMSSFTLISEQGDTLYLTRTSADGTYGKIYGSLEEGAHYALTTCDDGQAIGTLINLTQLDKHLHDYTLCNGSLILGSDTMQIDILSDETLTLKK